jgi:hypothetical protein
LNFTGLNPNDWDTNVCCLQAVFFQRFQWFNP